MMSSRRLLPLRRFRRASAIAETAWRSMGGRRADQAVREDDHSSGHVTPLFDALDSHDTIVRSVSRTARPLTYEAAKSSNFTSTCGSRVPDDGGQHTEVSRRPQRLRSRRKLTVCVPDRTRGSESWTLVLSVRTTARGTLSSSSRRRVSNGSSTNVSALTINATLQCFGKPMPIKRQAQELSKRPQSLNASLSSRRSRPRTCEARY